MLSELYIAIFLITVYFLTILEVMYTIDEIRYDLEYYIENWLGIKIPAKKVEIDKKVDRILLIVAITNAINFSIIAYIIGSLCH